MMGLTIRFVTPAVTATQQRPAPMANMTNGIVSLFLIMSQMTAMYKGIHVKPDVSVTIKPSRNNESLPLSNNNSC